MRRVTIKDVAAKAGVSVTLVSFVMNAKRDENGKLDCPVNANTAERVLKVASELGYKRNAAAASLRSGKSNTIAVIPTDISNKYFAGISKHIEDKAFSYGYTVLFSSSEENPLKLDQVVDAVLSHNIDGLIVAPVEGGEGAIRKAIDANIPVVLLDRDIKNMEGVGKVLLDDVEAGKMAADLLIREGYSRIEMISYTLGISTLREREEGYIQRMREAGLEEKINIHHTTYETVQDDVDEIVESAAARKVEALFLPTYSLAAAALMSIKKHNLNVPEDLAVIAFDNSNIYKLFSSTIAHIRQPLQELGVKSVEVLHGMMEGEPGERIIRLKPILVEGDSARKNCRRK